MHYYKFNIGDFDKVTRHLSIIERGLFRDLLDLYMKDEKPVASDMKKLERLLCVKSKAERIALQNVLEDFFALTDDGFYSEFCQAVLDDTTERADASRENGKKGGRPPKQAQNQLLANDKPMISEQKAETKLDESQNKPNQNLDETYKKPSNNLDESYPYTHNPLPNTHNPISNEGEKTQKLKKFVKPTFDELRDYFAEQGHPNAQLQANKFLNYYDSNGWKIKNNPMKDWKATVRNWMINDRQHISQSQNQSRFGTSADPLAVNAQWGQTVRTESDIDFDEWLANEQQKIAEQQAVGA